MHWGSVLLASVVLGLVLFNGPSTAAAQPSSAAVPGGLPINWALTPNDAPSTSPARRVPSPTATNHRERGLNENQLRALSWLGPGPWLNPGTPSGVPGAALVSDAATGKEYLLYEDGRTQLLNDRSTWKPF